MLLCRTEEFLPESVIFSGKSLSFKGSIREECLSIKLVPVYFTEFRPFYSFKERLLN